MNTSYTIRKKWMLSLWFEKNRAIASSTRVLESRNDKCFRKVTEEGYSNSQAITYLPLYDNFNIWLTGKELQQLKDLWNRYGNKNLAIAKREVPNIFIQEKLLEINRYRYDSGYEFTKLT